MALEGYPFEWLQELKERNNIVDVVSRYVPLKQSGNRFWACCPFHHEKTPSFCVNAEGKFYHCFGCGVGGDVIKFIQEIEGISFPEAVEFLAERAGMEIPKKSSSAPREKGPGKNELERYYAILKAAARYYHDALMSPAGKAVCDYLQSRGITRDVAVRFGLGYSPGFNEVVGMLRSMGYRDDEIVASGVGWKRQDGGGDPFDALQGRLIIPIIDARNRVVAFSGRAVTKEYTMGKYVHFKNTAVFDKSKTVYGVNFVKRYKLKNPLDRVIVVEGYMDVMSLYKNGFPNAVAGMGTAFTPGQARTLAGLCGNVYVCYDADSAGQEAALRNLRVLSDAGLDLHVMTIPDEGMDPDDFVKAHGRGAFEKLIKDALPYVEYVLSRMEAKHGLDSSTGQAKYLGDAMAFLKETVPDRAQRDVYLRILHDKTGVGMEVLRSGDEETVTKASRDIESLSAPRTPSDADTEAARFVLRTLVSGHGFCRPEDLLSPDVFGDNGVHRLCFDYLVRCAEEGKAPAAHMLYSLSPDDETGKILNASREFPDEPTLAKYYRDCVAKLNRNYLTGRIAALSKRFDLASAEERPEVSRKIRECQELLNIIGKES